MGFQDFPFLRIIVELHDKYAWEPTGKYGAGPPAIQFSLSLQDFSSPWQDAFSARMGQTWGLPVIFWSFSIEYP